MPEDEISKTKSIWGTPEERCVQEGPTRVERLERLSKKVAELFPGPEMEAVRVNITESFDVPQYGKYHNEGMYMDTHLDAILKAIDSIYDGTLPDWLPKDLRDTLLRAAQIDSDEATKKARRESIERYAFLHDISKKDCLTLVQTDGTKRSVTWHEWQEMLRTNGVGAGDPVALLDFCKKLKLLGISYYQVGNEGEHKQHGDEGASLLEESMPGGVDPLVATAIRHHEVGYLFKGIDIGTYIEYFGTLSEEERDWVVLASFTDMMGSLGPDGNPNLMPTVAITDSRHNLGIIAETARLLRSKLGEALAKNLVSEERIEQAIADLRAKKVRLGERPNEISKRIVRKFGFATYDPDKLKVTLSELASTGVISDEILTEIESLHANGEMHALDEKFGATLRDRLKAVKNALASAEAE